MGATTGASVCLALQESLINLSSLCISLTIVNPGRAKIGPDR